MFLIFVSDMSKWKEYCHFYCNTTAWAKCPWASVLSEYANRENEENLQEGVACRESRARQIDLNQNDLNHPRKDLI